MTDDDEANVKARRLLPDPEVAKRYGRTLMTLNRWTRDKELGFPHPSRSARGTIATKTSLLTSTRTSSCQSKSRKRKLVGERHRVEAR